MEKDKTIKSILKYHPSMWVELSLKDLCEICYGKDQKSVESNSGKYDIYGTGGVIGKAIKFLYNKPSILIGRKGSIDNPVKICNPFWAIDTTYYTKINDGVSVDWLFYRLSLLKLRQYNEASGVPSLSRENLYKIKILTPPLPEQQKIAAILSTWDDAIAKTQQLINQLKLRNHGLQQQLLSGKKRLKGFEKSKWVKVNASDVFKNVSVKNNDDNEQLLSVTQDKGAIPRDVLQGRVTMPSGDTNSFKLIEPGDFIISLRSFQGGLEYSEYRGLVSPAYTVLKSVKPINNNFYKYYFKSHDFIGHLSVAVIGIRDGKQISFDDFCTVKIPYPSLEEQNKITEILTCTSDEMKMQMQKIEALRQQKKGLMQQLLTGKIRVVTEN